MRDKRKCLLGVASVVCVVAQVMVIVGFSMNFWVMYDGGNAGLFSRCLKPHGCSSYGVFTDFVFLEVTRWLSACSIVMFIMGGLSECIKRCKPKNEGNVGKTIRLRLNEIFFFLAGLLATGAGATYASQYEDHFNGDIYKDLLLGPSAILVLVAGILAILAAVVIFKFKTLTRSATMHHRTNNVETARAHGS